MSSDKGRTSELVKAMAEIKTTYKDMKLHVNFLGCQQDNQDLFEKQLVRIFDRTLECFIEDKVLNDIEY